MKQLASRLWSDAFWRHNVIFLAGTLGIALLNYLYYPVLGRLMDLASFGEIQTLLSIFNVAGMLLTALQIVIVTVAANDKQGGVRVTQQFERLALLFTAVLAGLLALFSVQLQAFFGFGSGVPFIVLGGVLVLNVGVHFRRAFMQGRKNFGAVSLAGAIAAGGKLVLSAALVVAGWQTMGAITGMLLAQALALLYITAKVRRAGYAAPARRILPDFALIRPKLRFLGAVLVTFLAVTLMHMGDVLVVKRLFDPDVAGQYAGISSIAKIIFFATVSFAGVLLASVGHAYTAQHNRHVMRHSLALVAGIGGIILGAFTIMPEFIVRLLIGERYVELAHLLPLLGVLMLSVSLANLFAYYSLALRRYRIVPITIIGIIVTLSLMVLRHDTLDMIAQNFVVGGLVTLVLIGVNAMLGRRWGSA